jgi:hypothetical protein
MMLKLSLLNTATVMLLEAIGLGLAPMPSVVIAQDILLGQSFLSRFKSWSIDNDRHVLILRLP